MKTITKIKKLMSKNEEYYSIRNILDTESEYNMLLGERSNGKSYSVKEFVLLCAYNIENYKFGYLRRWREEIKSVKVENYFTDMPIEELTNGEYNTISVYRSEIFFATYTDKGVERGKKIGNVFCLTGETHYKSESYPDIEDLIFEEFITDSGYLPNEVGKLMSLVSTIARRRKLRVWLIGNTLSRLCPYFNDWQLKNVPKQKQGTIEIYKCKTEEMDENGNNSYIQIAVEYCSSITKGKMFFGQKAKMIVGGVWDCEVHPKLYEKYEHYKNLYRVLYEYTSFKFMINLLEDKDKQLVLYVYPYTKETPKNIRVVSDKFSVNRLTTYQLTNLTKGDILVNRLLAERKICFSDNLTGTEFFQIKKERGFF